MDWNWVRDAVERLIKTFLQAFLAQVTASGLGLFELVKDTSTIERAVLAGVAAVYSLVFSWVSSWANEDAVSPASLVSPSGPSSRRNGLRREAAPR